MQIRRRCIDHRRRRSRFGRSTAANAYRTRSHPVVQNSPSLQDDAVRGPVLRFAGIGGFRCTNRRYTDRRRHCSQSVSRSATAGACRARFTDRTELHRRLHVVAVTVRVALHRHRLVSLQTPVLHWSPAPLQSVGKLLPSQTPKVHVSPTVQNSTIVTGYALRLRAAARRRPCLFITNAGRYIDLSALAAIGRRAAIPADTQSARFITDSAKLIRHCTPSPSVEYGLRFARIR